MTSKNITCCAACEDGLREDNRHGLIYGPFQVVKSGVPTFVNRAEFAAHNGTCIYCNAELPSRRWSWLRKQFGL